MNAMSPATALQRTVRLRPDIEWSKFTSAAEATWVARDPVSLEYFHFSGFEKSIATRLDGKVSLSEILALPHSCAITAQWLLGLVARLDQACLTVPEAAGRAGPVLWKLRHKQQRNRALQRWLSPLAVRIKLFDPTRILNALAPIAKILFSRVFALTWLTLGCLVGFSVLVRFLQSSGSLAASFQNINSQRAIVLLLVFACVKSLHELGHALACKKWKAECHEIGLFFLVFAPCLYCDTSDSWKLSSRWRRACIAGAGIYVELLLAVIAGMLWLSSPAGSLLHLLAANAMIICTVSTVLVNANPLLRYDGYYMLSDVWGVPNLSEQSREALRAVGIAFMTAGKLPRDRWDANPRLLAAFGMATWIYRHFVVVVIAWVIWILMDGFGLPIVGAFLVLFTLANVVLASLIGLRQWTQELIMTGGIRISRLLGVLFIALVAGIGFFQKPWKTFVSGRAITTCQHITPIYAEQSGTLVDFARVGQHVLAGSELVRIESAELELELIETRGQVAVLEQRSSQLKLQAVDNESAVSELATLLEQLSKARDRLEILEREFQSQSIIAQHAGVLLAGASLPTQSLTELPDTASADPLLTTENQECSVERGTLLGWLSRPGSYDVTAYVAEHDAEILRVGMTVRCRWDCELNKLYRGTISRIAPEPMEEVPEALLGDESIPLRPGRGGRLEPESPHYEIEISLTEFPQTVGHQTLATVHFETAPRTLFQSLKRLLDRNIRPEL